MVITFKRITISCQYKIVYLFLFIINNTKKLQNETILFFISHTNFM